MNILTIKGLEFRWHTEDDDNDDCGTPWERSEGHGPVSDWTTRAKRAGERELCEDRGSRRYYDWTAAMKIAKKDRWGLGAEEIAKLSRGLGHPATAGEVRTAAVETDFNFLRSWCNDEWRYVGVVVKLYGGHEKDSIWGIESYCTDYIEETARELAEGIACAVLKERDERQYWAERDVLTVI